MHNLLEADLLQVLTTGRLWSIVAGLIGLTGIIIGRLALIRSARRISSARSMSIAAIVLGLISIAISLLHLASTTGGFGTGKGRAGAIVAIVLGLVSIIIGWRALARSHRISIDKERI